MLRLLCRWRVVKASLLTSNMDAGVGAMRETQHLITLLTEHCHVMISIDRRAFSMSRLEIQIEKLKIVVLIQVTEILSVGCLLSYLGLVVVVLIGHQCLDPTYTPNMTSRSRPPRWFLCIHHITKFCHMLQKSAVCGI